MVNDGRSSKNAGQAMHNGVKIDFKIIIHAVAQSICNHYSSLSGRPDIFLGSETLKKTGSKIWGAKSRVQKNRVIIIQKEKRQLPE